MQKLRSKILEFKNSVDYLPQTEQQSRKKEVVMNSLRSGHCFFSHNYLMNNDSFLLMMLF